jgi:hypothetical protein
MSAIAKYQGKIQVAWNKSVLLHLNMYINYVIEQ